MSAPDQPRTSIRLEERPIAGLRPSPTNVKQHSETQIEQIMASINRYGFNDPVAVMEDGLIVEGHGRYAAARRLEMRQLPVLVISGLSEREARAYAIAHNQTTANTGLDMTVVVQEFERLDVGADDYASLGFTAEDVAFLQPEEDTTAYDHNGHARGDLAADVPPVPVTHVTRVEFASQEEADQWAAFIESSKSRYSGMTIAERLVQFIQETSYAG